MKKLMLLLLIIILGNLTVYSQSITAKITGETKVCPNKAYTYVFQTSQAVDTLTKVTIFVQGGILENKNHNIADYNIPKGQSRFEFNVLWDDYPINNGQISSLSFGSQYLNKINVISLKGVSVNYIQSSPISINNRIIEIPYGQTGTITLTTSASYPFTSESIYSIKNFEWSFAGNTTRGNNTYIINYGATDLNENVISVKPIGFICNETIGAPSTITIKRTLNVNIISNSGNVACDNSTVSFSAIGIPNGATINWTAGNNFTLLSGQNTSNATFRAYGNGRGKVMAQVSIGGTSKIIENNSVWIGAPNESAGEISGFETNGMEFVCGSVYLFSIYPTAGTEYIWTVEGGRILTDRPSDDQNSYVYIETNMVRPKSKLYFSLSVQSKNSCGSGPATVRQGYVIFGDPIDLSLKSKVEGKDIKNIDFNNINNDEVVNVKVYKISGELIYSKNEILNFNVKSLNLKNGIYIIETLNNNEGIKREKIIINN